MNAYKELKSRQQARVDAFPLGAAFSDKQFTEMMTNRFGLQDTPEDRQKIISLGYGVFIRKSDKEAYVALMNGINKELEEFLEDDANFIAACEYEYANHECQISDDWGRGFVPSGFPLKPSQTGSGNSRSKPVITFGNSAVRMIGFSYGVPKPCYYCISAEFRRRKPPQNNISAP